MASFSKKVGIYKNWAVFLWSLTPQCGFEVETHYEFELTALRHSVIKLLSLN